MCHLLSSRNHIVIVNVIHITQIRFHGARTLYLRDYAKITGSMICNFVTKCTIDIKLGQKMVFLF